MSHIFGKWDSPTIVSTGDAKTRTHTHAFSTRCTEDPCHVLNTKCTALYWIGATRR